MLSITRSSKYYLKEWGSVDEKLYKEVIRLKCATSLDPISQFYFARIDLFNYGFNIDDQHISVRISFTDRLAANTKLPQNLIFESNLVV